MSVKNLRMLSMLGAFQMLLGCGAAKSARSLDVVFLTVTKDQKNTVPVLNESYEDKNIGLRAHYIGALEGGAV